MHRILAISIALLVFNTAAYAQDGSPDPQLQRQIGQAADGFGGEVGVCARHLPTGQYAAINGDSLFPTASMIKVPILLKVFDQIDRGELDYRETLVYRDSLLYEGVDILGSFKDGEEIELSRVVMLMITMSDNTAALWLQHLVGGGTQINNWLEAHGFTHTRVNSRTEGRRPDWERYGWGQTTPCEMAELLVMIREGRAVSPEASEQMYRILGRSFWDEVALSQIPANVQTASKYGAVNRSRSEAVLVNAPNGDYVFTVITQDQEDESWEDDNEGWVLIRELSRMFWEHFSRQ